VNSLYTSSAIKNRLCFLTISANFLISSSLYKYPVGFPGLQIRIALVLDVINFSKSSIGGNAKLSSILEITGTTFTPDAIEDLIVSVNILKEALKQYNA